MSKSSKIEIFNFDLLNNLKAEQVLKNIENEK